MANTKVKSKLEKRILELSKMNLPSQGKVVKSDGVVYQFLIPPKKTKADKK